uniref:Uncharacterized protein n=1 Tax=Ralstonia solanacearum TaxID=305 RepID=A0A0S4UZ97_RALSL|nr:conserved protein of unknown function [Ralstonia solanacearum]CUV27619.1 conserved protein of unknown function [Ralstonia solanacearum]
MSGVILLIVLTVLDFLDDVLQGALRSAAVVAKERGGDLIHPSTLAADVARAQHASRVVDQVEHRLLDFAQFAGGFFSGQGADHCLLRLRCRVDGRMNALCSTEAKRYLQQNQLDSDGNFDSRLRTASGRVGRRRAQGHRRRPHHAGSGRHH